MQTLYLEQGRSYSVGLGSIVPTTLAETLLGIVEYKKITVVKIEIDPGPSDSLHVMYANPPVHAKTRSTSSPMFAQ